MDKVFERHAVAALHFSGGKDSLACLWLLEKWWPKITVVWANAGAEFDETRELMDKVKGLVPNFLEVKTNQPAQVAENGYPVDVLPITMTAGIANMTGPSFQPFTQCCYVNRMLPVFRATQALRATLVIRGQKAVDKLRGPLKSGDISDGMEYLFPIENWSEHEVHEYVKGTPLGLPEHYNYFNSSLDCWSCTAYLSDNIGKMRFMRERTPEKYRELKDRLTYIRAAVSRHDYTREALEA